MKLSFRSKEHTRRFHPDDVASCRIECVCACTGILFFLPLVSVPNSRFGRYWANQGLIILFIELLLLLAGLLVGWILGLLGLIPFIGIIFNIVKIAVFIALCAAALFLIVLSGSFAARGRAKDAPFVGFMRFIK